MPSDREGVREVTALEQRGKKREDKKGERMQEGLTVVDGSDRECK